MKGFSAVEHKDFFDIIYDGEEQPFRVAKGSLSPDKMESIRKRAKNYEMGGYVDYADQEKETSQFSDLNDGVIPSTTFMADGGGYKVIRTSERKGKTHKVIGPDGSVKYFGDPNLKNRPNNPEAKKAYYARHAKSLKDNPHFRAYSRATWSEGGEVEGYADGGMPSKEEMRKRFEKAWFDAAEEEAKKTNKIVSYEQRGVTQAIGRGKEETEEEKKEKQWKEFLQDVEGAIPNDKKAQKKAIEDIIKQGKLFKDKKVPPQFFQDGSGGVIEDPPEDFTTTEKITYYENLEAQGTTLSEDQKKKLKALKDEASLPPPPLPPEEPAVAPTPTPKAAEAIQAVKEPTPAAPRISGRLSNRNPEIIDALPVAPALSAAGEEPVQSEEGDVAAVETNLREMRAFDEKKKAVEAARLDMIDAGVAADVAARFVGRALADERSYRRITSDAFKDALTQGATPEEAEIIVRQLDRSGEPINYRVTPSMERVQAVVPSGAPTPAPQVKGKAVAPAAERGAVGEVTAKVPPAGMPKPISEDAAQAKADAVLPVKPQVGEPQIPEGDLLQSPEYVGFFRVMKKNGASDEEAKALAKNYALKVYQTRTLDLRSDDEKRQEQLRVLADEAVKEQEFKTKLELAATEARTRIADQEAQILERKAQNAVMRSRVLGQKREALRNDIANFKEDPRRFFSSLSEGEKLEYQILAVIAGLGGRGEAMINNIVEKDLQRQRNELSKKQNLLGQYIQEGNEVDQAYNLAKATLKEIYATKLEQALRPLQDPLTQQQGRITVNKLRQDALKTELDFAKKDADLNFKEVLLQNKLEGMSVDQIVELAKLEFSSSKEARLAKSDPYAADKIFLAYQRENRLRDQAIREQIGKQTNETTQRFMAGQPLTALQLNDVPKKVRDEYMVPVFDDQGRPTGYFQAANSPKGKTALEGAQLVNKTIVPLLTDLEGQIKASTGPTGFAGWSSTASPSEYKGAQTVQLQLLYQLAQLFELGVVQKSDVDTLSLMIPDLTTYELASTKQAAVIKFKTFLEQAIRNNREQYLAKTDYTPSPAGTLPTAPAFTPTPVPAAPAMPQPIPIPPRVIPSGAGGAAGGRPSAPAKPPKFKSSSAP